MRYFSQFDALGIPPHYFYGIIGTLSILVILDIFLKGWSMWRAARMNKLPWFIALLIFNTIGILPAIFLLMTNTEYLQTMNMKKKS